MLDLDFFNNFRKNYRSYSIEDLRKIYEQIEAEIPQPDCFKSIDSVLIDLINSLNYAPVIIEFGGYKGGLARKCLNNSRMIGKWINYDLIDYETSYISNNYEFKILYAKPQFGSYHCDILVASHVFEHMKLDEIVKLILNTDCKYLIAEVPIPFDKPANWNKSKSTHVLGVGLKDLIDNIIACGFKLLNYDEFGMVLFQKIEKSPKHPLLTASPHNDVGKMSDVEYTQLRNLCNEGDLYCEVGSYKGDSAKAVVDVVDEVVMIDSTNNPNLLDGLINMCRIYSNVIFYNLISKNAALKLMNNIYDIVLIDGRHYMPNIKEDILNYAPKVRKGGLFVFHDYCKQFPAVHYAVDTFLPDNFKYEGQKERLIWFRKT